MTVQYDRQLSLRVKDAVNPLAASQATTISDTGTTTTFGEPGAFSQKDGSTFIEFGLPTPGSSAVKSGTTPTAGFDIRFFVRRGDVQTPNSCDVRIYNLSDDTANSIGTREFRRLEIQAGYPGNFGLIFSGDIKQVRIGRENAVDSYVDIVAADGDSFYNYANMSLCLAAGAKPSDAVDAFIKSFAAGAVAKGYTPDLSNNGSVRNRIYYGMTKDELWQFGQAQGVLPNIQHGRLNFVPLQGFIPSTPVIISPQTGLLGVPEQTQNGIECTVLLNPQIKIGQLVELKNTTINLLRYGLDSGSQGNNAFLAKTVKVNAAGKYYVMSADHIGETRGNTWDTKLTLLAVDAQIPNLTGRESAAPSSVAIRLN